VITKSAVTMLDYQPSTVV